MSSSESPRRDASPDIPDLSKKEDEERKRGGAWLLRGAPGASGAGAGGLGASAGSQAGFLGSRAIAAALSRMLGGSGTWLGGFFASNLGANLVAAAIVSWGALVGTAGYLLYSRSLASQQEAPAPLSLAMGRSGIVIDSPRDRSLGMASKANQGEILWDEARPKDEGKAVDAKAQDSPKEGVEARTPDMSEILNQAARQGKGLGDGFTRGLSKSLAGNGFRTGGLLAMGTGTGKGLQNGTAGFQLKTGLGPSVPKTNRGKLASFQRGSRTLTAQKMPSQRGSANRAMGQLKLSRALSTMGAASSPDSQARQYESDAFDQQKTAAGTGAGIDSGGAVVPPGTGAPDTGGTGTGGGIPEGGEVNIPTVGGSSNYTPYQTSLDSAKKLGNIAGMLKMIGMILVAAGAVLIAIGASLLTFPTTAIGVALMAAGAALVAMGIMMMAMASKMASMAKSIGSAIEKISGQVDQAKIVSECAEKAASQGTPIENCNPSTKTPKAESNSSLQEDIDNERKAGYKLK